MVGCIPGQPVNYSGGRIERLDLTTGALTVLYDACDGRPLCEPNDLVFDRSRELLVHRSWQESPQDRDRTGVFYAQADGSQIKQVLFPSRGRMASACPRRRMRSTLRKP